MNPAGFVFGQQPITPDECHTAFSQRVYFSCVMIVTLVYGDVTPRVPYLEPSTALPPVVSQFDIAKLLSW